VGLLVVTFSIAKLYFTGYFLDCCQNATK